MRPTAQRHLHVLVSAAVLALSAILSASAPAALAADSGAAPAPYVLALDPGHGGSADNNNPALQFDSGAKATNGLLEKDLTLAVAKKLKTALESDRVKVVMTRDSDQFVSIAAREALANQAHADLFVSIHFNYFDDPSVGGSLVLYPSDRDKAFAGTMAAALESKLKPLAVTSNGTMLKPELWTNATMPTITVEAAYLTNPREADLLTKSSTIDAIAASIDSGVLAQAPEIAQRKAEFLALEKAQAPVPVAVKTARHLPLAQLFLAATLLAAAVVYRRQLAPVVLPVLAAVVALITYAVGRARNRSSYNHRGIRRRRSRARPWPSRA